MTKRRFAALPAAVAVAVVAQPGMGLAADFTIWAGQTRSSTQVLSGVGDRLSINAGGAVSTSGDGVNMDAFRQSLVNRGAISTYGEAAYAAVANGNNATVLNSGSIETHGVCSYGVFADTTDHFRMTNNGTISTFGGEGSYAVYVENGDHATVSNNGLIRTTGEKGNGITVWGSHARIVNHGTISAGGTNATGVYAWYAGDDSRNVVVNTGTIRAIGTRTDEMYGQGIYANAAGMTVINSGSVSSQYEAIFMGQTDQTLTLLAGSRIFGGIRFEDPDTATLNFGRGLDARLTLTLPSEGDRKDDLEGIPGTINVDGQILRRDGNVLTVVSPETNRAGATIAAETSRAVVSALRGRVDRNRATAPAGMEPLAYGSGAAAPAFPQSGTDERWAAWTNAYGSGSSAGDSGTRVRQGGVLFGFDRHLSEERFAGLFGGVGQGVARLEGGSKVETTTVVAGAYGSLGFGAAFVDVAAAVGATLNDSERQILNNTAAKGYETAMAGYDGYFFSPSVTIGFDHQVANARLTPSVSLLYAGIRQDGYGESGSSIDLEVGSTTTHVFSARGELEIGTLRSSDLASGWSASARLGAEGTFIDGSSVDASLLGDALPLAGFTTSEARGFIGADIGFSRGGYDFSAKGEIGSDTAGVLSAGILGGISARF